MTTRRDVLQLAPSLALGLQIPLAGARASAARTLLILGGTGFIGPHLTQAAQSAGWQVTHFNRGRSAAARIAGVETLMGDRAGRLDSLRGRRWDAVIDDTGYIPGQVRRSSELLAPDVGYCLFVSTISVYADLSKPTDESSPTVRLSDPETQDSNQNLYGGRKILCEQAAMTAFRGRGCVVRPGYIVGPLDPTDRFTYWPVRASKSGEMLAPGSPTDPVQVIDVRDLAHWMMRLVDTRAMGIFNAISPPRRFTMGALMRACLSASPAAHTRVTWVPARFLARQWEPEELDLPPWLPPTGDTAFAGLIATRRAQAAGLQVRPLADSVRDTLAWFQSLPAERQAQLRAGLDAAKEAATLRQWHEQGKVS